ncbi:GH92 family glycosyl hydrolase [Chitinophaga niabensis]|uniref:Alpha-1,2-mannosidase, putative n=1 Tax=Chitinophaga niabensis TaxID=536979 RepID=A0A1N6IXM5_9BACT|nr:GH92 family glycosyl hydrolase [Chitinophaga niabensis]SIO36804.1 alpha-1,2-mannosidase, putative [Chitinophaga niabensis]
MNFKSIITCALMAISGVARAQSLTSYVDPHIGSGGHGHVFVGASVPFGAIQPGPTNIFKGWDWDSGYNYGDSILIGFAHLHLNGTGIGDLGDILVMPYTGDIKTDKGTEKEHRTGYASLYSHQQEKVKPGYYSVLLQDYNIFAELTATTRVGFHRYKFPGGKTARVIVDLKEGTQDKAAETFIEQVDEHTFKGHRFSTGWAKDQRVYFAIRTSLPVKQFTVYNKEKGLMSFDETTRQLQMKVSVSSVSADNALANIAAEVPGWDFDAVAKSADEQWNKELSKIKVETKDVKSKRIFYTSLYHTMINPSVYSDHNGDYRGPDKKVYEKAPYTSYTIFSMWDTYRAAHPLYTIIDTERAADMIRTMLSIYEQQGKLPIWHLYGYETGTMVGISSLQIIAEAYLKGIKGLDATKLFEAMKATANTDYRGLDYVRDLKPIPADKVRESVARGLEYAISDASIAEMAKKMNRQEDYKYFSKRASNYQLYFDPATRFFRAKLSDGSFKPDFDPMRAPDHDYTEGNAWQYLWLVPYDVPGLSKLLGGDAAFASKLDSFFSLKMKADIDLADLTGLIGQYAHGNEPGHHIPYLYAFVGQQWKVAEKTRYIMKEFYHDQPDGIVGNEDCGQMSAWNVFSSLGFYPVYPAAGVYVIGSPSVDKGTIHTSSGKDFVIEVVNNSPENIYIQKIELNGKAYTKSYLLHTDLMKGGKIKMFMGAQPNYNFGKLKADRP